MTERLRGAEDYTRQIEILDEEDIWRSRSTIGLAELAARLGAPSAYERHGLTTLQDIFAGGLNKADPWNAGPNSIVTLSAARCSTGGYSAKLHADTTANNRAGLLYMMSFLSLKQVLGVEFAFSPDVHTTFIEAKFALDTGHLWCIAGIRLNLDEKKLYYYGTGAAYVDSEKTIAGTRGDITMFRSAKFTWDLEHNKYGYAFVDDQKIDLRALSSYSLAREAPKWTTFYLYVRSDETLATDCYIDKIILTTKEPLT